MRANMMHSKTSAACSLHFYCGQFSGNDAAGPAGAAALSDSKSTFHSGALLPGGIEASQKLNSAVRERIQM